MGNLTPIVIADAETMVIGAVVTDVSRWNRVAPIIGPESFSRPEYRIIAEVVRDLATGDGGDFAFVVYALQSSGRRDLTLIAGEASNESPGAANLERYAELVAEGHRRSQLATALKELVPRATKQDASVTVGELASLGERLLCERSGRPLSMAQAVDLADARILERIKLQQAGKQAGVPMGLPAIDRRTGGWLPGQLVILAGRPGLGKTALALQGGLWAARHGHPGLIVSLEMGADELAIRAMAASAHVNVSKLAWGDTETHAAAARMAAELGQIDLHIETSTYRLDAIVALIRLYAARYGIGWAAVDHIGLIEANGFSSRVEQLGAISRALKQTARKAGIPIIGLSQLNRSVEKDRRKPVLADLRDSGSIEQDADIVLMLHSSAEDNEAGKTVSIGLLKNRNGRKGWLPETIEFDGATQTFSEASETVVPIRQQNNHWSERT